MLETGFAKKSQKFRQGLDITLPKVYNKSIRQKHGPFVYVLARITVFQAVEKGAAPLWATKTFNNLNKVINNDEI